MAERGVPGRYITTSARAQQQREHPRGRRRRFAILTKATVAPTVATAKIVAEGGRGDGDSDGGSEGSMEGGGGGELIYSRCPSAHISTFLGSSWLDRSSPWPRQP